MLLNLDMLGIAVSTGSACTSGDLEPSHVLLALGRSHELCHEFNAFYDRGRFTTEKEIDYLLEQFPNVVRKLACPCRRCIIKDNFCRADDRGYIDSNLC